MVTARPAAGAAGAGLAAGLASGLAAGLLDARTGIIRRLESPALPDDFPPAFHLVSAVLSDSRVFSPWPSDPVTAGCALDGERAARDAAVGEAVERYCGNIVRSGLRRASYSGLAAAGEAAVDPATLALYARGQYREARFPYVPFERDLEVRWTPGRTLPSGTPVWVPASLVWVTYTETDALPDEPRTNGTIAAGIAAGPSRAAAEFSALLEVVERDALALAWAGAAAFEDARPPPRLQARLEPAPHLRVRCFAIPAEAGLPVRAVLVRDESRGYLTLGTACRPDPDAAMTKAVVEALQLQLLARQLDDPGSAYAMRAGRGEGPLRPWREDRRYTRSYRADLRDAVDPLCNLQLYLDPALQERFEAALRERLPPGREATGPAGEPAPRSLAQAVARLGALGHEVHSVEVTTSDLDGTGLHVVRVVVPGYVSNWPPAFPFAGGTRLARATARSGLAIDLPLPH